MPLKNNALLTLAETKSFLTVPSAETSSEALIEGFINECSELIERYCGRVFIKRELTEKYSGHGGFELMPKSWPIVQITSLHDSVDRIFDATSLVDPANYETITNELAEPFLVQRYDSVFNRGLRNIKLVYQAGYNFEDIPSDIKLACKIAVAYYFNKQQQKDWTQAVKSKGDENISMIQGLPKSAVDILAVHKRLEILGDDISS